MLVIDGEGHTMTGSTIELSNSSYTSRAAGGAVSPLPSRARPRAGLVGREDETAALWDFLDEAFSVGASVMISGAAGVGKTRLLEEVARRAADDGALILNVAGVDFEGKISYSSLHQLLLPLLDDISALSASHAQALGVALSLSDGEPPRPLLVANAVFSLLSRAADSRPLLLVVDDFHWADRASASVIGFIARRVHGSRIGVLAAYRTSAGAVFERAGVQTMSLHPLSRDASEALVAQSHPTLPARLRSRLIEDADGIPLALLELADSVKDIPIGALPPVLPLTERLESVFAERVEKLSPQVRDSLLLAALDGRREIRALQEIGVDVASLADAEGSGVVSLDTTTMTIRFAHPLVRSAIVARTPPAVRRDAHRIIAQRLVDDPDRRAWHLAETALAPDESIAQELELLARRALARGDASAAISALIRSAQISPARRDESRRLSEAAYLGADITGELTHASELLANAKKLQPEGAQSLHAAAAAAYLMVNGDGDVDSAHRLLVRSIETGDHEWSPRNTELVEALSTLLLVCWWAGREEYWEPFFTALERFEEVPELLDVQARTFPDTARASTADRDRLAALVDRLDAEHDPNTLIRISTSSVYLDLLGGCRRAAWRLIEDGRQGGAVRSSLGAYMHICLDDFATGRWDEEDELADEGMATARQNGYGFIIWYFMLHKALVAAVRGDITTAYTWADQLSGVALSRNAIGADRFSYHPRTLTAVAAGDWEAAYRYASTLSPAGVMRPYTPHAMWVGFDLVEAAVRTGRHNEARAHVAAMNDTGMSALSSRLTLLVGAANALVSDADEAVAMFESALRTADVDRWPFDLARVQLAFGERLRRNAEYHRAREVLHGALANFERLGATPWANRTREELRAARDPEHVASGRATFNALTAQERAIVELAAQGLTNKEIGQRLFLSPRTVSGHLYRAFPKLGVSTRAALRDVLLSEQRGEVSG